MPDPSDLERLFDEVRLLFNTLVRRGESLHRARPVTMAQRAVLEFLRENGPATVPDIARWRNVSRQHIQALVNSLLEMDQVRLIANPAHQRSRLVALTNAGRSMIDAMKQSEKRFFAQTRPAASTRRVQQAADTLAAVRASLDD